MTNEQVEELRAVVERGITDEELARASAIERDLRHDVMAHVHCLGESCPKAKPIIHLGCTSQDVVCNADLISLAQACDLTLRKLDRAVVALGEAAERSKSIPTLGFTHYQVAQPVTVGRRCAGWAHDLDIIVSCEDGRYLPGDVEKFRGMRGATGTQASFLNLFGRGELVDLFEARFLDWMRSLAFGGSMEAQTPEQVLQSSIAATERTLREATEGGAPAEYLERYRRKLEELRSADPVEYAAGKARWFQEGRAFKLVGQTYPRVADSMLLGTLASIAAVLHKIATDIRLLSNRKEIDEPFGKNQIGSSAMPYKRNPMKCERICGLTRFVMNLVGNAYDTAATQWLERTLDDSSNRRLSLPEAFLALDGALDLMHQVASGLVVNEAMVRKNLMEELPFLATENILMEAVKAGGDRQDLHEKIRVHAQAAGARGKQEGLDNDLIERLRGDEAFKSVHHLLTEEQLLDPMKYVGRSVEQTERFLAEVVEPLRERYADELESLGGSDRGV